MWRLPLPPEYRKDIESDMADLKNIGDRVRRRARSPGCSSRSSSATAPWVHLDIAGPARADGDDGYLSKGATGAAVRTLLTWLERRSAAR